MALVSFAMDYAIAALNTARLVLVRSGGSMYLLLSNLYK